MHTLKHKVTIVLALFAAAAVGLALAGGALTPLMHVAALIVLGLIATRTTEQDDPESDDSSKIPEARRAS